MKKILKYTFLALAGLFLICSLAVLGYMGKIYINFLQDRDVIFHKIEEFNKALTIQKETDITLGVEEFDDSHDSFILDRNGKVIAKYSPEKHTLSPLEEMPYFLTRGFIYIEDRAFFKHRGINPRRIFISGIKFILKFGRSGGGSTISQQLAKILFTKHERSIKRKIYELYCTLELESRFSKNELLRIYLNSIYMGHGTYGIADASKFYFGKSPAELTVAEAALFIGMNRSPELYSPIRSRKRAEHIQKVVLQQFVDAGFLRTEDINYETERFWKKFDTTGVKGSQSFWKTELNRSGYVTEYIRQILNEEFSYEKITRGGIVVHTTIDLEKQILAEKIMSRQIKQIRRKIKKAVPESYKEEYTDELLNKTEGSFVSVDYTNGQVLALVGGSGYNFANQLNRAAYARRPIGSSVKPFVYAFALEQREIGDKKIHPFSKYKDEIVSYTVSGKKYTPMNYHAGHKYGNLVTLYDAVKTSLNTVAVALMNELDIKEVADFIRKAAFIDKKSKRVPEVLSLALGTCEMSAMELAGAYSLFPRGGKSVHPVVITKITDYKGNVYFDYQRPHNPFFNFLSSETSGKEQQLISPQTAYEIVQMLEGVFEPGGTGYWPARLAGLKKVVYGKSGTSQEFKDGWFAGFSGSEVSVCWVGIDTNKTTFLPGSSTAGMIWSDYNAQTSSSFYSQVPVPKKMKKLLVDLSSGLQAGNQGKNTKYFYFQNRGPFPEKHYSDSDTDFLITDEDE